MIDWSKFWINGGQAGASRLKNVTMQGGGGGGGQMLGAQQQAKPGAGRAMRMEPRPVYFEGAMIVLNVNGKPRFVSYMDYHVSVYDQSIIITDISSVVVTVLSMTSVFGVYKNTAELIKAWTVNLGGLDDNDSHNAGKQPDEVPNL